MTGALTVADMVNPIRFTKGDVALHAYANNVLGVLDVSGSVFRDIEVSNCAALGFRGSSTSADAAFKIWDGVSQFLAVATMKYGTGYNFELSRAGDITMLTDKMIQLSNETQAPAASATHRGKYRLVHGGAGVADLLYCCMKSAADTYSWVQVASG